jgi:pyruvate,water dikinase
LQLLGQAVDGARRNHRHVGICGEAPANYPEIVRFLIELKIDSISVNPSSALKLMRLAAEIEAQLPRNPANSALAPREFSSSR